MKVKINSSQHGAFLKALKQAEVIAPGKNIVAAITSVLIRAKGNEISIQGNNLEQSIVITVDAEVIKEGEAGASAKDLCRIISLGKDAELEASGKRLIVKCAGTFHLPILAVEEFPKLPEMGDGKKIRFTEKELRDAMRCDYASSKPNEQRYNLQGVCLNLESKQGVASDGKRCALSSYPPAKEGWGVPIIPSPACKMIDAFIDGSGEVDLVVSESLVLIDMEKLCFSTRLIDGTFPNIVQIIPKSDFGVRVNRKDFLACIDRSVVAQSDDSRMKLTFSKADVQMSVTGKNADAETSIVLEEPAPKPAHGFSITLSSILLREAVSSMKDEVVSLEFNDELSPVGIKADSYAIVMPMRGNK